MSESRETKKNEELHLPQAVWDLIFIAAVIIGMLILSYFFDVFVVIARFLQKHPEKITYVDEVFIGFLTLSVGLAVFSWRRWIELKKETAERIKKQEELLKITETQAEVERIISKQLHADMDIMKQDVREILHLLSSRPKR